MKKWLNNIANWLFMLAWFNAKECIHHPGHPCWGCSHCTAERE